MQAESGRSGPRPGLQSFTLSRREDDGVGNEIPPPYGPVLLRILTELQQIRERLAGVHKALYTVEEIAEVTGRSPYTIRQWVKKGRIKATRVGGTGPRGRLLIPREELTRLIASGTGGEIPDLLAD